MGLVIIKETYSVFGFITPNTDKELLQGKWNGIFYERDSLKYGIFKKMVSVSHCALIQRLNKHEDGGLNNILSIAQELNG